MGQAARSLQIKILCNHKVKARETNMIVILIQGFGDSVESSKHSCLMLGAGCPLKVCQNINRLQ
jgi:hypothetical protein